MLVRCVCVVTCARKAKWVFVCCLAALTSGLVTRDQLRAQASRGPVAQTGSSSAHDAGHIEFLNKYCFGCHNERLHTANLSLDKLDLDNMGLRAETWERVLRRVSAATMPPANAPAPDRKTADAFVSWLEAALDRDAADHPYPGRVPVHRLNRVEYANAVHDLLALDVDTRSLLVADDVGKEGFDNMAGVLSLSPLLLEQYMSSARKISRLAIGDTTVLPGFENYEVPKLLVQDDRVSPDLPFGSRGGIAIHHLFPVDGEYVVKIRLRRQLYHYILGLGRPHQIDVRLDGQLIKSFTVGGAAPGKPAPASFSGNVSGDPEWETYMHFADDPLEVRFPSRAGTRVLGVSFAETTSKLEGVLQPDQVGFGTAVNELYDGNPSVESIAIGGPYHIEGPGDTASRRIIFICKPANRSDEESCARKILSRLARRAYRRPVTEEDLQPLMEFYKAGRDQGTFEAAIQLGLESVLTDPDFLFRIERTPPGTSPGTVYRLTDLELASRLSFFLWSSIPDDELLDLAASGKLRTPAVLAEQVQRMLSDHRSQALVDNFASQWLKLTKLRSVIPDPQIFPEFDENLREAFEQETKLFVESQLRADRGVLELLNANYTFLNARLARHYSIPDIHGDRFRKVIFGSDERGGLLGQGSILLVTSYPNRTSPVIRGKWVLDNILGDPPPPPPADIPLLKEDASVSPQSIREQMEQHRKNSACAGCHARMDPIGFALENFDAVGRWRGTSEGAPIDVSGVFPDGTHFTGLTGLRKLVMSHPEEFVATLTGKLLTYALGRELEYSDLPSVRKIVRDAASREYRWSALLSAIVDSTPFQMSVAKGVQAPSSTAKLNASSPRRSSQILRSSTGRSTQ
jgi:hypothetical protein